MLKNQNQKKMKKKIKKIKNREITGYYGYWDSEKKKRMFKTLWQEKN